MEISVIYKDGAFYARNVKPTEPLQSVMKDNGWKFNLKDGWFTTNIKSAAFLREHADEKVKKIFERAFIRFSPWEGALTVPKGLSLLPFQPGSAMHALNRNRSCLALSPGLGKTIVAAVIAASMRVRTLIVCPPFLMLNTLEEFQKWAPKLHTRILDNVDWIVPDVLIVPDSQITNPYVRSYIDMFQPELFIGDEWHRFKTDTAQRSKAVYGYRDNRKKVKYTPGILDGKHLKKIVLMSGTIMPNRPMELYPLLRKCAGQYIDFMNKNSFGLKYCDAFLKKSEWTGQAFGYDFTGCDEKQFRRLMRQVKSPVTIHKDKSITVGQSGFMLRLNKSILGLPPLTEEIVILGDEMPRSLKSMNAELLRHYSPKDLIKLEIKRLMGKSNTQEDVHLMTYRRLLGEYKVKPSCEYIESILEETEENLLIVALHKEVIRATAERLYKHDPLIITGDTPTMKRQKIVKEYQTSKKRRIILGNIDAIGVGFTLTKANRVLLIEYLYSPGGNRQVIDRAHRYGVEHELLAQYLCFRNSLDRSTIETLLFKEKITAYV
jgi:SWI/SNF-related matrix-associated actin-dependent regulator 1 of chromatin subfamily A